MVSQVSAATLSRIENQVAKLGPDTDTLIRLANVCRLRLEDILRSDDDAENSQIQEISTQLRVSKRVSSATMQALEAIIRAAQIQPPTDKTD